MNKQTSTGKKWPNFLQFYLWQIFHLLHLMFEIVLRTTKIQLSRFAIFNKGAFNIVMKQFWCFWIVSFSDVKIMKFVFFVAQKVYLDSRGSPWNTFIVITTCLNKLFGMSACLKTESLSVLSDLDLPYHFRFKRQICL
jgi:hypothetical protein